MKIDIKETGQENRKCKYHQIKEELKSRQAESQDIRKHIHTSSGKDRWNLWQKKRFWGQDTRVLLLAYAFLRGVPYRVCEPKIRLNSGPYICSVHSCLEARGHSVTEEAIKTWGSARLLNIKEAA